MQQDPEHYNFAKGCCQEDVNGLRKRYYPVDLQQFADNPMFKELYPDPVEPGKFINKFALYLPPGMKYDGQSRRDFVFHFIICF